MLNTCLVHVKTMQKSNKHKDRNEHFVIRDTVSRSRQNQLESLLKAVNEYFQSKIKKRNVTIEV
jgi:coproporphyrinogen III oxidase-like Fe-S oxidoreductase